MGDSFVKSPQCPLIVIPAPHHVRDKLQQESRHFKSFWVPVFAGMTRFLTFYDSIKAGPVGLILPIS